MRVAELGEFVVTKTGSTNPSYFPKEQFEYYSIPAYDNGEPETTLGSSIGSSKKNFLPGDVLLSRIVPHIRRCWIVPENNGYRQIGSGEWIVFRTKDIAPSFLRFYLMSDAFNVKFMMTIKGVGGSLMRADPNQVKRFKLSLPPLEEQKKIAVILGAADDYRQKTKALIEKYDQLTQSLFLDMFGNPVTNPKGWILSPLGEVIDVRDGTHDSPKYIHEGYPLITSKNIVGGKLKFNEVNLISKLDFDNINKRSKVDYGDIIMPMIGTIGNPVEILTKEPFAIKNVALFKKSTDSLLLIPVLLMLLKGHFLLHYSRMNNRGGTQKFLSLGAIRKMPVFLPPLSLQNQFAERIAQIEKQKQQAEASLVKAEELFNSLLQKAFKG